MKILKRKTKGLTLVELIAVLALTPIIIAAIYESVVVGYRLLNNGQKLSNVQEEAKTALQTLTNQLKNCRYYLDTYDFALGNANRDTRFDSIEGEKICYIEGHDKKKYLYVIKTIGSEKQLYLYTFDDIEPDTYKIEQIDPSEDLPNPPEADRLKKYKISTEQFEKYRDHVQYETNRIFLSDYSTRVKNIPSNYTGEILFYDEYDWKMYFIAYDDMANIYVKFPLESLPDTRLPNTGNKIMSHIQYIYIEKDPYFTGEGTNKKCKIQIRAEDDGKVKELTSDVFIFEKI
ncbi:PilW family protein [Clostridium thermarum]|uniref:PilW family protein n=1 Tax=Clostridium thermarum TaxID=1716543 RepID=UPI0013D7E5BF|nr:prepilin-type N-terminal cleavage/methylation domain-containing protein [Clostridium thermarum]